MQTNDFQPAERVNRGLVSTFERSVLTALAGILPDAVKPDHLTALGFGSLLAVGLSYWYARYSAVGLWLVILFLGLNWFGDSLDGTLARFRSSGRVTGSTSTTCWTPAAAYFSSPDWHSPDT
jgi:hypothetical protein